MSGKKGKKKVVDGALKVNKGVDRPPSINPGIKRGDWQKKKKTYLPDDWVENILDGNTTVLSQFITLIESSRPGHFELAQEVIEKCLPHCVKSRRIGITGVPGVGKSTFIETFGKKITGSGHKLAVLAVDPSSSRTGGSILGDKTRMESLASDPSAYIRPSPSAGSLGGVARKTRETIIVCEAAGFDTIFVETVGVGQSETKVHSMVDFFLLLMLAGAGDELQGIKRGIMELADGIAITKADGDNKLKAEEATSWYRNALSLFPPNESGWKPAVVTSSAVLENGVNSVMDMIDNYFNLAGSNGYYSKRRLEQAVSRMHETIKDQLNIAFYSDDGMSRLVKSLEEKVTEGKITSYKAATIVLNKYLSFR